MHMAATVKGKPLSEGRYIWGKAKSWRKNIPFIVMLTPFLIIFVLFMLLPVLMAVALSMTDFNMLQMPSFVGAANYIRLFFEDDVFMIDIKNTLILAVITGPIGYILSFVVAWFINEFGRQMRRLFTLVMYAPVLCGNIYFIWLYIFSADSRGFLNDMLFKRGMIRDPMSWLTDTRYNLAVVTIVTIWLSFGAGFLSFISGLQSLDRTYYEAAAIDGLKNRWQELYYVTFPQMKQFLLFGAVISISGAFSVGAVNQALTGFPSTNYSTDTILLHIMDYGQIRFEMGYASAIAVVLFGMMLGAWAIVRKALNKFSA